MPFNPRLRAQEVHMQDIVKGQILFLKRQEDIEYPITLHQNEDQDLSLLNHPAVVIGRVGDDSVKVLTVITLESFSHIGCNDY
jgi:hypothetical protein